MTPHEQNITTIRNIIHDERVREKQTEFYQKEIWKLELNLCDSPDTFLETQLTTDQYNKYLIDYKNYQEKIPILIKRFREYVEILTYYDP